MRTKGLCLLLIGCWLTACKKSDNPAPVTPGGTSDTTTTITPPVDPSVAATIGFFLDNWQAKTFSAGTSTAGTPPSGTATDALTIDCSQVLTKVPNTVYGNNTNLWMGQIVSVPSLLQYIKDLSPHILRAPAGSISDIYFWNGTSSAVSPTDAPANLLDANGNASAAGYWYGGNTGTWTLALSNYYSLLSQTQSTGIITVNYGYARYGTSANPVAAAAHLAADWVRYDNGRTKYWEVGNENYGNWEAGYRIDVTQNKDGQPEYITGDLYGKHFKVFADSMKAAAAQVGATIYIGATLVESQPYAGAYNSLTTWNQGVLTEAATAADFYVVHNYYTAYNTNSSVSDILGTSTTVTAGIKSYVSQQLTTYSAPVKPIALTEWNIQAVGSGQDVSYIAGIHAAKTLGAIIKNQFGEASRWDLANGWNNGDDQGMFSNSSGSGAEPGANAWNPRPSFFYLYYFQQFFGDRMIKDSLAAGSSSGAADLTSYSSSFTSGQAGTILINSGTTTHTVSIAFKDFAAGTNFYWYTLTGGTDNGDFSRQVYVNGTGPSGASGGPSNYASIKPWSASASGTIKVSVPARSVVYVVVDKK